MSKKINYFFLGIILVFNFIFLFLNNLHNRLWGWDESVFIGMGKYIASAGKIGLWEHIRPLGVPFIHSIVSSWLNYNPIYVVLIFSVFSLLLIAMVYLITYEFTESNWIASLSALLLVFNPLFIEYSLRVLTTIPATAIVFVGIYLFIKKRYWASGLMCGIAFLFRFTHILIGAGLGIILIHYAIKRKKIKHVFEFAIPQMIIILGFFTFNYFFYSNFYFTHIALSIMPSWKLAIVPLIEGGAHSFNLFYSGNFWYYIIYYLQYPFLILGIFSIPYLLKKRKTLALLIPSLLMLIFYQLITNKQYRFSISFLPFLIIASVLLFKKYPINKIHKNWKKEVISICMAIILIITFLSYGLSYSTMHLWERDVYTPEMLEIFSSADNFKGKFFTTNPSTAVYSDRLFMPIYNHPDVFMQTFNKNNVDYIFYHDTFFPFGEVYSKNSEKNLSQNFEKYVVVFESEYKGTNYKVINLSD